MFKIKSKKNIDQIIFEISHKDLLKRYLTLIIGCLLISLAFNIFFLPNNIVYGGVSGISIVVNKLFNIEPSIFVLITSLLLLVVSFFTLGL